MLGLLGVWSLDGVPTATVGGFGGADVGATDYGSTTPEPNPCVREYFLNTAAHSQGEAETNWYTDVSLFNLGGAVVDVD